MSMWITDLANLLHSFAALPIICLAGRRSKYGTVW